MMTERENQQMTLLALVAEMADECYIGRYDEHRVMREIDNPEWKDYLWCKNVPDGFQRNWQELSLESRLAIFAMTCIKAI